MIIKSKEQKSKREKNAPDSIRKDFSPETKRDSLDLKQSPSVIFEGHTASEILANDKLKNNFLKTLDNRKFSIDKYDLLDLGIEQVRREMKEDSIYKEYLRGV
jgi:hypothetical protein